MNNDTDTGSAPGADPNNVIPPNEMEHRRRVIQCISELGDLSKSVADRVRELREMGVPMTDWVPVLVEHGSPVIQGLYHRYGTFVTSALDGLMDAKAAGAKNGVESMLAAILGSASRAGKSPLDNTPEEPDDVDTGAAPHCFGFEAVRMKRVIDRLFSDAPKMTDGAGKPDPTQAPALQCHVMLKAGGSIQGALSVTPEGTLRMMAPNQIGQKPVMVEHFFDYEQVADIAIFREVKTEGSRIVTS